MYYLIQNTHPEWHDILSTALDTVDKNYLSQLETDNHWLPGSSSLLNAFSIPLSQVKYVLLGESPYPRPQSANGYAFWDNAVHELWSKTGFSKEVNRATSLRNWIKMLLVARGDLNQDVSQAAIAALDKAHYCQTLEQFFISLIHKGFLLLNASLVFSENKVLFHAKKWQPFMNSLLQQLAQRQSSMQLLLLGRIAKEIPWIEHFSCLMAEHPYNLSFIRNPAILEFFKPLDLLSVHSDINEQNEVI